MMTVSKEMRISRVHAASNLRLSWSLMQLAMACAIASSYSMSWLGIKTAMQLRPALRFPAAPYRPHR
jgi:hypothetical protein